MFLMCTLQCIICAQLKIIEELWCVLRTPVDVVRESMHMIIVI